MGDKIESKKAAAAAHVSTVPGYLGVIESPEHAVAIAGEIGFVTDPDGTRLELMCFPSDPVLG